LGDNSYGFYVPSEFSHQKGVDLYRALHRDINSSFSSFDFKVGYYKCISSRFNWLGGCFDMFNAETHFLILFIYLLLGVLTYGSRFPEKYFPFKYDICVFNLIKLF
jgi:hypothetical protein